MGGLPDARHPQRHMTKATGSQMNWVTARRAATYGHWRPYGLWMKFPGRNIYSTCWC